MLTCPNCMKKLQIIEVGISKLTCQFCKEVWKKKCEVR